MRFNVMKAMALLCVAIGTVQARAAVPNHTSEMPPLAKGQYAVGCTNLTINTTRFAQLGGAFDDYLDGKEDHYIGDILADADTLIARPLVPNSDLYPGRRNSVVDFVNITCYPTDNTNPRSDYLLPGGQRIPHMQRAGEAPLFASQPCIAIFPAPAGCGKFPMLVFSHGLSSNPADSKSIDFLVRLASYGYIVTAPFHGDPRFSRVRVEDLSDVFYLLFQFDRVVELQALRPLAVKSTIDLMLAHPQFRNVIDANRIGGIGGSMGGATFAWLLGADITCTYPGLASRPTVRDPRIKAAVGYVPYAGMRLLPAFGDDNATARNVNTPYLAISGTADSTAPINMMEQAMNNFRSARFQVALADVEHTYKPEYADDVFGWALPFFDAYLNGNKAALDRLTRQRNVAGGLDDQLSIDYTAPLPLAAGEVMVDEFYNTRIRRYFMTSREADKEFVDRVYGPLGSGRTGYQFKGYTLPGPTELRVASQGPVCRYYVPVVNTHFYSVTQSECDLVKGMGGVSEGIDFWIERAPLFACPTGTHAVTRLYNNRWREVDSAHRWTTSRSLVRTMVSQGWIDEGVVMCAPL